MVGGRQPRKGGELVHEFLNGIDFICDTVDALVEHFGVGGDLGRESSV